MTFYLTLANSYILIHFNGVQGTESIIMIVGKHGNPINVAILYLFYSS